MKYQRILLKLSGESLLGKQSQGIDPDMLSFFVKEVKSVVDLGCQVAIVIGGGNIFRGMQGVEKGFDRAQGDYMGMLAITINCLALQTTFDQYQVPTKLLSGVPIGSLCEAMNGRNAIQYLESGQVVMIAGGTGNPYFTTDSASALRALEVKADVLLKGTRVDGVYDADPEKNPAAKKFETLSFDEAYNKNLKVMDLTAFTLCKENKMPLIVFDMNKAGNLKKIVAGEAVGTLLTV